LIYLQFSFITVSYEYYILCNKYQIFGSQKLFEYQCKKTKNCFSSLPLLLSS